MDVRIEGQARGVVHTVPTPRQRPPRGARRSVRAATPRPASAPVDRARELFDANGDGVIENWSIAHGGDSFANFDPPPSGAAGADRRRAHRTDASAADGASRARGRPTDRSGAREHAGRDPPRPRRLPARRPGDAPARRRPAARRRARAHRPRARAGAPAVARARACGRRVRGPAASGAPAEGRSLAGCRTGLRCRRARPRSASRSRRASSGSRRCRRGRPSRAASPGTCSRRSAAAGDRSSGLRAITASMTGASRCSLSRCSFSSRSANSGSTSRPNSSSASMMCSWRFLPAWKQKITWSTPHSS